MNRSTALKKSLLTYANGRQYDITSQAFPPQEKKIVQAILKIANDNITANVQFVFSLSFFNQVLLSCYTSTLKKRLNISDMFILHTYTKNT